MIIFHGVKKRILRLERNFIWLFLIYCIYYSRNYLKAALENDLGSSSVRQSVCFAGWGIRPLHVLYRHTATQEHKKNMCNQAGFEAVTPVFQETRDSVRASDGPGAGIGKL